MDLYSAEAPQATSLTSLLKVHQPHPGNPLVAQVVTVHEDCSQLLDLLIDLDTVR